MEGKQKYSEKIMRALRANRWLEEDDTSQDESIMKETGAREAFAAWLNYEGIIYYDEYILTVIDELYGTHLKDS